MKNAKNIIATLVLAGIMGTTAMAGNIGVGFNSDRNEAPCTTAPESKTNTSWGILISDLFDIITGRGKGEETTATDCGILVSD